MKMQRQLRNKHAKDKFTCKSIRNVSESSPSMHASAWMPHHPELAINTQSIC